MAAIFVLGPSEWRNPESPWDERLTPPEARIDAAQDELIMLAVREGSSLACARAWPCLDT